MIRASMRRRLILFDIDGTLLKPMRLGRRSIEAAFRDHYGEDRVYFAGIPFHGRTDFEIVDEAISKVPGRPSDAGVLIDRYLSHLRREVDQGPPLVLAGVADLL